MSVYDYQGNPLTDEHVKKYSSFLVGPWECKAKGHKVMAYAIYKEQCPLCEREKP